MDTFRNIENDEIEENDENKQKENKYKGIYQYYSTETCNVIPMNFEAQKYGTQDLFGEINDIKIQNIESKVIFKEYEDFIKLLIK